MNKLWDANQVAEFLGLAVQTVYTLSMRHQLPTIKLTGGALRFDPEDIEEFVKKKKRAVAASVRK